MYSPLWINSRTSAWLIDGCALKSKGRTDGVGSGRLIDWHEKFSGMHKTEMLSKSD